MQQTSFARTCASASLRFSLAAAMASSCACGVCLQRDFSMASYGRTCRAGGALSGDPMVSALITRCVSVLIRTPTLSSLHVCLLPSTPSLSPLQPASSQLPTKIPQYRSPISVTVGNFTTRYEGKDQYRKEPCGCWQHCSTKAIHSIPQSLRGWIWPS